MRIRKKKWAAPELSECPFYTKEPDKYKGKWEIRTLLKNKPAQDFWRKVVKNASNGIYEEHLIRNNTRYAFYFEN